MNNREIIWFIIINIKKQINEVIHGIIQYYDLISLVLF